MSEKENHPLDLLDMEKMTDEQRRMVEAIRSMPEAQKDVILAFVLVCFDPLKMFKK